MDNTEIKHQDMIDEEEDWRYFTFVLIYTDIMKQLSIPIDNEKMNDVYNNIKKEVSDFKTNFRQKIEEYIKRSSSP